MSLSHLPPAALAIASEQGWDEATVIIHLVGFIAQEGLTESLSDYLEAVADEEDSDLDFSDPVFNLT